nr:Spy/CpxP family protein refolding chaperone [Rhodoferax sp.]
MKSGFKSLVLTGLLASAGFATFAQTAPAPDAAARPPMMDASGPRGGMGHGVGPMGMRGHMDPAKMEAIVAKHQAAMKAKLKITADQEGAWTTFTTAMKPPASWMNHKRPDRAEMDKLTTPERIDKMHALRAQHTADMNAAMDKRDDATKAFYAVLNADQKKIFDAEHARMDGRRGEHRHGDGAHGKDGDKPAAAK